MQDARIYDGSREAPVPKFPGWVGFHGFCEADGLQVKAWVYCESCWLMVTRSCVEV
jgi:hypothetical protein